MDSQQKRLMEAFHNDCQTLLTRFELSYNTHFQNFCDIWKDMQFSLIFVYHPSETALIAFCEDALCITKQFFVNASNLKESIGALYLVYGTYYKMPMNHQLKIRMMISDWKCLLDLYEQVKAEEYLDANYILCKLIVDHAFIHCISDNEFGIEKHFYKKHTKLMLNFNLMPTIKELAAPEKLLSTISKLSKIYEKKKHILFGMKTSSLQLYDANIADNIVNNIRMVQSESKTFAKPILSEEEANTHNKHLLPSTSMSDDKTDLKIQKRMRLRKSVILSKIGRAFEKGLQSESSEEEINVDSEFEIDFLEEV